MNERQVEASAPEEQPWLPPGEMLKIARGIVHIKTGVALEDIDETTDLHGICSSLDQVEIVMEIESAFGVQIDDNRIALTYPHRLTLGFLLAEARRFMLDRNGSRA